MDLDQVKNLFDVTDNGDSLTLEGDDISDAPHLIVDIDSSRVFVLNELHEEDGQAFYSPGHYY